MLSDPLAVTYDGIAYQLNRVSMGSPIAFTTGIATTYRTADGEFEIQISKYPMGDKRVKVEILLTRVPGDPDQNPFTGEWSKLPNSFGFVYVSNDLRYMTSTDVPLLRAALESLVDSGLQTRLLGGES